MGSNYDYFLYFPKRTLVPFLRDLARRSGREQGRKKDRSYVKVIAPDGTETMFPSWDTLTTPPTPVYDLKTEPSRWVGVSLVVPVLQKERRAFREHSAEENPDRGIVHLHLTFDLKEGLDKSFVQVVLRAPATSSSWLFPTDSFHQLIASIMAANEGLCAILAYEPGNQARLTWLKGQTLSQPISKALEIPKEEPDHLRMTRHFTWDDEMWYWRRFDLVVEEWLAGTQAG